MGRNAELCPRRNLRRKRRMEKRDNTQKKDKVRSAKCTSSDDEEEWPCLVCGEPYGNSRSGSKWVQ